MVGLERELGEMLGRPVQILPEPDRSATPARQCGARSCPRGFGTRCANTPRQAKSCRCKQDMTVGDLPLPPDVPENRLPVQHAGQVGAECSGSLVSAERVTWHVGERLCLNLSGDLSLGGYVGRLEPLIT